MIGISLGLSLRSWGRGVAQTAGPPSYFASASVPADNASSTTQGLTVTPPASMRLGDLVAVLCQARTVSLTWTITVSGGQTWTSEAVYGGSNRSMRLFWCRFNGTWAADPAFDAGAAPAVSSAVMHVFRPDFTTKVWAIDVAFANISFTAPVGPPYPVPRAGLTTVHADSVTMAVWSSIDDNAWGNLTGSGWIVTGPAQYRNTAGQGQSSLFTHQIKAAAATVIPAASADQDVTTGPDAGHTAIIAWYAA
jgi:hypothetical protein